MTLIDLILSAQAVAAPNPSEKVLIWTLIVTNAVTFGTLVVKGVIDQVNRIQDRLDAQSKAKILLEAGKEREKRLIEKIDQNTEISATAFDVANGHNAKIVALREEMAAALREIRAAKEK